MIAYVQRTNRVNRNHLVAIEKKRENSMIDHRKQIRKKIVLQAFLGSSIMIAAELLLRRGNSWVSTYFTPIVWTGYILLADSVAAIRRGESPLCSHAKEFAILIPISITSWYIFEGINLLLRSWYYAGLPPGKYARWLGYAWSYATISPAIFVTASLVESFIGKNLASRRSIDPGIRLETSFFWIGFGLFLVTLLFPSPWLCPLPWVSLLLWFEGMNDRLNLGSFAEMFRKGDYSLFVSLILSGGICGILWESWNWRTTTRWHYNVPYLPQVKLFEMPVLGYMGFLPFALECYLIYRFMRWHAPIELTVDIMGRPWNLSPRGAAQ